MLNKPRVLSVLLVVTLLASLPFADGFAQNKKNEPVVTRTLTGTGSAGEPFPGPLPGATVYNARTRKGPVKTIANKKKGA